MATFNFFIPDDYINFRYRLCLALIRMEEGQPKETKVGIADCIWCFHSCVCEQLQLT